MDSRYDGGGPLEAGFDGDVGTVAEGDGGWMRG